MKMWTTPQVQNELIADLRKAISRANEGSRTKLDNGSYDSREWLSSGGAIDDEGFSSHIQAACGYLWLGPNDFRPLDSLQISPKTLRATGLTHGLTHVPVVIQEVNQTELELLGALCISSKLCSHIFGAFGVARSVPKRLSNQGEYVLDCEQYAIRLFPVSKAHGFGTVIDPTVIEQLGTPTSHKPTSRPE